MIPVTVPVDATLQAMYPGYEGFEYWVLEEVPANPPDDAYIRIAYWNEAELGPQPTDQEIIDNADEGIKGQNSDQARVAREQSTQVVMEDDMRTAAGLSRRIDDPLRQEHIDYIAQMDTDVDNPSTDPAYKPPLPPSVEIPATWTFKLTFTRVPGWNDVLGWRCVMSDWKEGYFPANASLSVYSAENCTTFEYTPGAFTEESPGVWVIICPAGQEKGDVDYHFGVTYSGVDVECKTFLQGQQTMVWDVNAA